MERLGRRRQDEGHDAGGNRVHPALSASHSACRIRPHPAVRVSGQPRAKGKARALPDSAERGACGKRRTGAAMQTGAQAMHGLCDRPYGSYSGRSNRAGRYLMKPRTTDCPRTTSAEAHAELRLCPRFRGKQAFVQTRLPNFRADPNRRSPSSRYPKPLVNSKIQSQEYIQNP